LTLAEVLIALTVLSIGLVAMISLLPSAASGLHEGGQRSIAVFLASDRLEQIRHAVGSGGDLTAFADEPALAQPYTSFDRVIRVRDCGVAPGCSGSETPGVRQLTVTVTYPASGLHGPSPAHRGAVVLSTYIGPR
jgi:hypothetical protein